MEIGGEAERERLEAARAKLRGIIRGKLMEGTYDELKNAHLDALVVDDHRGHHSEHEIARDEAEAIERALWSAGEDQTFELVTNRIVNELEQLGFDFHASELPEVSLVVRRSA